MVPLASLAALICVGIGVDFSGQTIAEQDLRDQATFCAQQGAGRATLAADATAVAVTTAQQCLTARGLSGTVTRTGSSITVDLTGTYSTKLLTIIGIDHLPVHGTTAVTILQTR